MGRLERGGGGGGVPITVYNLVSRLADRRERAKLTQWRTAFRQSTKRRSVLRCRCRVRPTKVKRRPQVSQTYLLTFSGLICPTGTRGLRYRQGVAQTPSTGLRHPSFVEGAGKRCSECGGSFLSHVLTEKMLFYKYLVRVPTQSCALMVD